MMVRSQVGSGETRLAFKRDKPMDLELEFFYGVSWDDLGLSTGPTHEISVTKTQMSRLSLRLS